MTAACIIQALLKQIENLWTIQVLDLCQRRKNLLQVGANGLVWPDFGRRLGRRSTSKSKQFTWCWSPLLKWWFACIQVSTGGRCGGQDRAECKPGPCVLFQPCCRSPLLCYSFLNIIFFILFLILVCFLFRFLILFFFLFLILVLILFPLLSLSANRWKV